MEDLGRLPPSWSECQSYGAGLVNSKIARNGGLSTYPFRVPSWLALVVVQLRKGSSRRV
jgi:hypothetical protein